MLGLGLGLGLQAAAVPSAPPYVAPEEDPVLPPTGDPTPSRDDILLTREIKKALDLVGIKLHDHLIIGKEGHASLRSLRVIEGWH